MNNDFALKILGAFLFFFLIPPFGSAHVRARLEYYGRMLVKFKVPKIKLLQSNKRNTGRTKKSLTNPQERRKITKNRPKMR